MKRAGNLYDMICDPDNLRLAWYKAKRGKEAKPDVIDYGKHLQQNLSLLRGQLLTGEPEIGDYHFFTIYEPKERLICAASFAERVLHHAIMNVCHPVFEKFQIHHSYATRPGKGQYAALETAKNNQKQYIWFCKLDIRKYFSSVSHELLMIYLRKLFKDNRLLVLFDKIIRSDELTSGNGLPIGNLTSQYFANYFLALSDHFLLEKIGIPAYVRYMDDMVLWHNNKSKLIEVKNLLVEFIEGMLHLSCKPSCINSCGRGLPFLGYVVFPQRVRLNKQSKKRFVRKLKIATARLEKDEWDQHEYARRITPLFAFAQHADTHSLRKKLIS